MNRLPTPWAYPAEFRPLATTDLVRVGAQYDGGYVLPARLMSASEGLLSFGLSDQWEFEAAFLESRGKRIVCFDHSVDANFWFRKFIANLARGASRLDLASASRAFRFVNYYRFFNDGPCRHIRQPIGYPGTGAVDLVEAMNIAGFGSSVLLKMDIEGWEYRVLSDIVALRDRFSGLIIEFHDVDLHQERIVEFIRELAGQFVLVHFHANSHTVQGPGRRSIVVEMSIMNRRFLAPEEVLSYRPLPIPGLDAPNIPGNTEAAVSFVGFDN
jgi:hypothetical protein